jgi:hypothetical protein
MNDEGYDEVERSLIRTLPCVGQINVWVVEDCQAETGGRIEIQKNEREIIVNLEQQR